MRFLFLFILSTFLTCSLAQYSGAKQNAMAGCGLTSYDVFSSANSVAAIAFTEDNQLGLAFNNSFLFPEINQAHISFNQASQSGAFSYKFDYFGFALFNTLNTSFAYAHRIEEQLGFGLRLNYHRIFILEQKQKHAFSFDIGMLYAFNDKFRLALSVRNPAKMRLEPQHKETLPTQFLLGASFHPNEKIVLAWEFQKDMQFPLRASLGIDYLLHPAVHLRTGISIHPLLISGGMGFEMKKTVIALSSTWDTQLGYSPQISFSYAFSKKN